jgi:hypothetical protein
MALVQNYSMPLGDSRGIPYTAPDFDCTGQELFFTVSRTLPDGGVFMFQKRSSNGGITISNPVGCISTINLLGTDQVGVVAGSYFYSVTSVDGAGKKTTLTKGQFVLEEHAN